MPTETKELCDTTNFTEQINGEDVTEIEELKTSIPDIQLRCYEILKSNDWTRDKIASGGDEISFKFLPSENRRIYRIKGVVDISAEKLMNFLYDEIESNFTWNKHVEESKIIKTIDKDSDLIYQAAKSYGNGFIGARDFVFLRHREKYESYHLCTYVSVNLESIPAREDYIRGEHGTSFQAARNLNDNEDKCEFIWVMNTDMRGWIPRKIVDMCKSIGMSDFMKSLRLHVSTLKD